MCIKCEFVVTLSIAGYVYVVETLDGGAGVQLVWPDTLGPHTEPYKTSQVT